jgi:hypothetical protein
MIKLVAAACWFGRAVLKNASNLFFLALAGGSFDRGPKATAM